MSVDADDARLLGWRCAHLIDRGEQVRSGRFQGEAVRVRGRGPTRQPPDPGLRRRRYVDGHPAETYLRDARVMTRYEGTSHIQKLLIGRAETGISAFI
jgi:alkylation response protein AidB-like acyl-CoA dehydrogenase